MGRRPNVTQKLLEAIGIAHGTTASAESLFSGGMRVYGILGVVGLEWRGDGGDELELYLPHYVPITRDGALFSRWQARGRIWLNEIHTSRQTRMGGDRPRRLCPPNWNSTVLSQVQCRLVQGSGQALPETRSSVLKVRARQDIRRCMTYRELTRKLRRLGCAFDRQARRFTRDPGKSGQ